MKLRKRKMAEEMMGRKMRHCDRIETKEENREERRVAKEDRKKKT